MRATMAIAPKSIPNIGGDAEVVRALLAKGANPNINAMGLTPFLVAAGVGAGNIAAEPVLPHQQRSAVP